MKRSLVTLAPAQTWRNRGSCKPLWTPLFKRDPGLLCKICGNLPSAAARADTVFPKQWGPGSCMQEAHLLAQLPHSALMNLTWLENWGLLKLPFSSVQFSCSVTSDSLRRHEAQHARPPCPSPTPGVHPNPCPLCRWCHPTISSSVVPFSSCPQSFPASGSFQMSQLSASGGQSIGV